MLISLALVASTVVLVASTVAPSPAGATAKVPATTITLEPGTGRISPDLFGANLLWPYGAGGAFDRATRRYYPGFVSAVRRSGIRVLRWPGGTTADSYFWQRAIGPLALRQPNEPYGVQNAGQFQRGTVLDGPVPSVVGPSEFGQLLNETGASGSVVVNFATGTLRQAVDLLSYLTAPVPAQPTTDRSAPGYWAELRAKNGHVAPYPIRYVEIGNEQNDPAEYGWRSGALVSFTHGAPRCPTGDVATCLYAFGGTTRFSSQAVGTFANELPEATYSTGRADQHHFVYYPPVVPRSMRLIVNGAPWQPVARLASAARGAHVYRLVASSGEIMFGNGVHGAIPPRGAAIRASYDSGPHAGFVAYDAALRAVDPKLQVCESEQADTAFLSLMGRRFPYGCVELHQYATPRAVRAPLATYESALMAYPVKEGHAVMRLERLIRHYAGRSIPIALTEYGQTVRPMPEADPAFILSLDESILIAAQLRQWIDARLPLAEKYLLSSSPFLTPTGRKGTASLLAHLREFEGVPYWVPAFSIGSAMIAGPGPRFVEEPSAEVLQLMSHLAGESLLSVRTAHVPSLAVSRVPALLAVAGRSRRALSIVVINDSPTQSVRALVDLSRLPHGASAAVSVLDGPSASTYNTPARPDVVRITDSHVRAGRGGLWRTFPAHSVTLLRLSAPAS